MSKRIWIDLENSPHVPFFVPIILELERNGCEVFLTARDFAQTKELVQQAGLNARIVGGEYGNSTLKKTAGLLFRALRLASIMRGKKIDLAVGHGSRGLLLAARMLQIPVLTLYDYEGASVRLFNRLSTYVMTPDIIPFSALESLGLPRSKHLTYPGIKENVYVSGYKPSDQILRDLELDDSHIIITIRPPSITAHYRSDESFRLFDGIIKLLATRDDIQVLILPRDHKSAKKSAAEYAGIKNFVVPEQAVNGLDLIYASDLIISGGGTMNREAAALGVTVVTIFKGPMGAVDKYLINKKKMIAIDNAEEILLLLRKREQSIFHATNETKDRIVSEILRIATIPH